MVAAAKRHDIEQDDDLTSAPEGGTTQIHVVSRPRVRRRERTLAELRALAVWPRLDQRILAYARGDAVRLARAIARQRTTMTEEQVRRLLAKGEDE